MVHEVEAVYEHGVLRPLKPLSLNELQRVKITISDSPTEGQQDAALLERIREEVATLKLRPTIEEVRAALASIPGSLADDIIAERGDY